MLATAENILELGVSGEHLVVHTLGDGNSMLREYRDGRRYELALLGGKRGRVRKVVSGFADFAHVDDVEWCREALCRCAV